MTKDKPSPNPDGPHTQPYSEQHRVVAVGRTIADGDTCTVIVIYDGAKGFVLYPYGLAGMGVRISARSAATVGEFLIHPLRPEPPGENQSLTGGGTS